MDLQQQQHLYQHLREQRYASTHSPRKSIFPQKLWRIINDSRFEAAIRWTDDGTSFYLNETQLRAKCLGKENQIFCTQQPKSFVRQLHLYGFKKIDKNQFMHPSFQRNRPAQVREIRRTYGPSAMNSAPHPPTSKRAPTSVSATRRSRFWDKEPKQRSNSLSSSQASPVDENGSGNRQDLPVQSIETPEAIIAAATASSPPRVQQTPIQSIDWVLLDNDCPISHCGYPDGTGSSSSFCDILGTPSCSYDDYGTLTLYNSDNVFPNSCEVYNNITL